MPASLKPIAPALRSALLRWYDAARRDLPWRAPPSTRGDPYHIFVSEVMLPHFDAQYAARLVLGRHWTTASATQRSRFVDAFYHSLLRNYGNALVDFTPERLKVLPYQGSADAPNATVRTQVRKNDGTMIAVNYSLHRTSEGWKAWDVTIEGISYVKSFRDDFGSEIDQKGLESVIERLEAGDLPASAKKGKAS